MLIIRYAKFEDFLERLKRTISNLSTYHENSDNSDKNIICPDVFITKSIQDFRLSFFDNSLMNSPPGVMQWLGFSDEEDTKKQIKDLGCRLIEGNIIIGNPPITLQDRFASIVKLTDAGIEPLKGEVW